MCRRVCRNFRSRMELCAILAVIFLLVSSSPVISSRRPPTSTNAATLATSPITSMFHLGPSNDHRRQGGVMDSHLPHKRPRHSFSKDFKERKPNHMKPDRKPNIILILTDDQDVVLRSMDHMPKALKVLQKGGAHFKNAFVTTPMCCPSRSSILTGMYVHNHNVFTNNDNCSSKEWQRTMETRTFATYLSNVGYRTGYFGKYLNEYNGSYIPPGWREWSGLIRNSRFYNYTVNFNGIKRRHGDDYHKDYYPDLITNESIAFFRQSKQLFVNKPVMMVLSYPAPHGPEDAAPQYQNDFPNVTTHRTDSWNYAPNPDKQWILRETGTMDPIHMKFTDALHRKRLQTLQSVDDALDRIYGELKNLGELNNTYIIYTSDHGYHLGQFGLVKGKAMPFDFDVRVPFFVRGPRVPQGVNISNIVLNLDLAPTILDIAGVEVPDHMDGRSVMKLIIGAEELHSSGVKDDVESQLMHKKTWRDTFLIESAGRKNAGERQKQMKTYRQKPSSLLASFQSNKDHSRLSEVCREKYKNPCSPTQRWKCFFDGKRWRMQKCRLRQNSKFLKSCDCSDRASNQSPIAIDPLERRRQRAFLRDHVGKGFKPQFIRGRRSSDEFDVKNVYELHQILELKYEFPDLLVIDSHSNSTNLREAVFSKNSRSIRHQPTSSCKMTKSSVVNCSDDVYNNPGAWRENKNYVDSQIKILKVKLDQLKDIRKHLKHKRPGDGPFSRDHQTQRTFHSKVDGDGGDYFGGEIDDQCICDGNSGRRKDIIIRRDEKRRQKEERHRRRQEKIKRQERKSRRKSKYGNYTCNIEKMNCFVHDNDHWKTPPFWTDGPFCFCQNSNNNTYWCLRTINASHDFLYCEFITGFISFYDMKVDPYQLQNVVEDVPFAVLNQLHIQLMKMRACQGARECTVRSRIRGGHFTPSLFVHDEYDHRPNNRQGRPVTHSTDGRRQRDRKLRRKDSSELLPDYQADIDDDLTPNSGWGSLDNF